MSRPEPLVVTPAMLRDWPLPGPGSGKRARGQVLVVGGSRRTPGAVLLAGTAALRAGAGKLRLATAATAAPTLAVAVPESGVYALPETDDGELASTAAGTVIEQVEAAHATVVGSGMGDVRAAVDLLAKCLPEVDTPLVVDALGAGYLTEQPDALHHLDGRVVLTVNPDELSRTAGRDTAEVEDDPLPAASAVSERSRVVVLCGGERKHVVTPEGRAWVVEGGGPGLGVSGSGDVQAGIVGGLLARGATPAQAAVWAAHLHARGGERLAADVGTVGYLASELPARVPAILAELA